MSKLGHSYTPYQHQQLECLITSYDLTNHGLSD